MNRKFDIRCVEFLTLAALLLLSGCGKVADSLLADSGREIRVQSTNSPDRNLLELGFFFAEYLLETSSTSVQVAVILEPRKTPMGIMLNPSRYISGLTGTDKTSNLIKQFAPMKFYSWRNSAGKHLSYAFLRPRESLRTISVHKGRYWLEIFKTNGYNRNNFRFSCAWNFNET